MNWALQVSAMHTEKDLELAFVLDSKINKEYVLDKTTEKLHHRKKVGDREGLLVCLLFQYRFLCCNGLKLFQIQGASKAHVSGLELDGTFPTQSILYAILF